MRVLPLIIIALWLPGSASAQDADLRFQVLSAGQKVTCGLTTEGQAYCWGADTLGQLGAGGASDVCETGSRDEERCARTPTPVAGEHRFAAISVGDDHVCALDPEGAVYCWGSNIAFEAGVPYGGRCEWVTDRRRNERMEIPCEPRPVRVPFDRPVVELAAGIRFTCGLDSEGQAWCWGSQGRTPAIMPVKLDARVSNLDAGGSEACALTAGGEVRCWDARGVAEATVHAPVAGTGWRAVAVAENHGCALDVTGHAHCWGNDSDGSLGRGPGKHEMLGVLPAGPVVGDRPFAALAVGTIRTCGIDDAGALYCWGRVPEVQSNSRCLSSNGVPSIDRESTNDCVARPAHVQEDKRFRTVAIGWSHQCGLTVEGVAVCWGRNELGQLGDGSLLGNDDAVIVTRRGMPARALWVRERRASLSWLWSWTGAILVLTLAGAAASVRPLVRWWRRGRAAALAAPPTGRDWPGIASLIAVVAGWAVVGLAMLSLSTSELRGEIGYGLAMLTLTSSAVVTVGLAIVSLILGLIGRRSWRSSVSLAGLGLSAFTLLVAAGGILWFFAQVVR